MDTELLHEFQQFRDRFDKVVTDVYNIKEMYDDWLHDDPFIEPVHHTDRDVLTQAPSAGDLAAGEVAFGDGTGPNSRDEIFWSVDGQTVARVEADAIIS